jgi:hypothetical protein
MQGIITSEFLKAIGIQLSPSKSVYTTTDPEVKPIYTAGVLQGNGSLFAEWVPDENSTKNSSPVWRTPCPLS